MAKQILTVGDLVAELLKQDQGAPVGVVVRWAGDAAYADLGETKVHARDSGDREDTKVLVEGWLSNCDTTLDIGDGR